MILADSECQAWHQGNGLRDEIGGIRFKRDVRKQTGIAKAKVDPKRIAQLEGIIGDVEEELMVLSSKRSRDGRGKLGLFLENLFPPKVESESEIKELQKGIAKQESELAFLRLKLNSDAGREISEGEVVIITQNRKEELLYAHKFVLSSKSPVFCKMFETEMLEKEQGVVRVDDATLEVMRAVIRFCYDAQINFTEQVPAEEVFEVAHKYDIPHLWKICEEHLTTTISDRNLAKRLKLAKMHQATNLEAAASQYFKDNFDSVLSHVVEEL